MLGSFFKLLFGSSEDHKKINTSIDDITYGMNLTDREYSRLEEQNRAVYRSTTANGQDYDVRAKMPRNEQRGGCKTLYVEVTDESNTTRSYHKVEGSRENYGVGYYEVDSKTGQKYKVSESCYKGHHGKYNGEKHTY